MSDIGHILSQRKSTYGDFTDNARVSQSFKEVCRAQPGWVNLSDCQKEAMEMVLHKFARIINGDPSYEDSWVDCIGYIKLVTDSLLK